ncbi:Immune-associated nucleotide-binding protein 9, partial [Biomphalaria glabrata]
LKKRVENLHSRVVSQDKGSGHLASMIQHTANIKNKISQGITIMAKINGKYQSPMEEMSLEEKSENVSLQCVDLLDSYSQVNKS